MEWEFISNSPEIKRQIRVNFDSTCKHIYLSKVMLLFTNNHEMQFDDVITKKISKIS